MSNGVRKDVAVPDQQYGATAIDYFSALQEPLAGGIIFQVDQATLAHQAFSGHERERGEDANLLRRAHLPADRYRQ